MTQENKEYGSDPAIITDHAFEPKKEWWSLCKHCNLAQAAHAETTIDSREYLAPRATIKYYSDDTSDEYVVET